MKLLLADEPGSSNLVFSLERYSNQIHVLVKNSTTNREWYLVSFLEDVRGKLVMEISRDIPAGQGIAIGPEGHIKYVEG